MNGYSFSQGGEEASLQEDLPVEKGAGGLLLTLNGRVCNKSSSQGGKGASLQRGEGAGGSLLTMSERHCDKSSLRVGKGAGGEEKRLRVHDGGESLSDNTSASGENNIDIKRARRMQRNRDSAARSRKRRLDRIDELEHHVQTLEKQKSSYAEKCEELQHRVTMLEEEARLRGVAASTASSQQLDDDIKLHEGTPRLRMVHSLTLSVDSPEDDAPPTVLPTPVTTHAASWHDDNNNHVTSMFVAGGGNGDNGNMRKSSVFCESEEFMFLNNSLQLELTRRLPSFITSQKPMVPPPQGVLQQHLPLTSYAMTAGIAC